MRVHYSVPDLSCEHCRRAVLGALGDLGFTGIEVNLATKQVALEAEEAVLPVAMKALAAAGYPASRL